MSGATPAFVTGGSGFVGRAILRRLVADGREVRALARSGAAAKRLEADGASVVRGDLMDPSSLRGGVDGCGTVFHVAGVNELCLRDPSTMYRVNVQGTEHVVRAAAEAGVGRVVYTSSAATIGEDRGTVGREDSPHRGRFLSHYERSKHLAERRASAVAAELGVALVSVNPASVQGPERTSGTARLLLDVVNGRLPVLVDTTLSFVDVDDCVEGHLRCETAGVPGQRYLLCGATMTTAEALALLEEVVPLRRRPRVVPGWTAAVLGLGGDVLARLGRDRPPVCREAVRVLLHGHRYDGSRAERELGLRYTDPHDTFARTLRWYAQRGLVDPIPPPEPTA